MKEKNEKFEISSIELADNSASYITLEKFLADKKISISECIKVTIQICRILNEIHSSKKNHGNISSLNVLIDPDCLRIIITELNQSVMVNSQSVNSGITSENSLYKYISPEQTGRINRAVDWRSDFYSLGIVFYEMLTGAPPFNSADSLQLVHSHIAMMPVSPYAVDKNIPLAVSKTVMKLLAKNPEDRYQSAFGLNADLEFCLSVLEGRSEIDNFLPGCDDIPEIFHIPQKLYGRDREIKILIRSFDSTRSGLKEILLMTGSAGIGKTAIVRELQRCVVEKRSYFIEGKFDKMKQNIPYSAIVFAFQQLVRQIMSEGSEAVSIWRGQILSAVIPNGKLITDVIPELEMIIGPQPVIESLSPEEAVNRYRYVFQNFVRVFANLRHSLVVFLDDLHWVDQASLKLIEFFLCDKSVGHLLFVGAYRDNEVDSEHLLTRTLNHVRKSGAEIRELNLQPFLEIHIRDYIIDTLRCGENEASELANICFKKTHGNPFYLNQFLHNLNYENRISFDHERRGWRWDAADLHNQMVTENVAEFMIGIIKRLPAKTMNILVRASCLGYNFDIYTLSVISDLSEDEVVKLLTPAITFGLIVMENPASIIMQNRRNEDIAGYQFVHDRIHNEFYELTANDSRKRIHLLVGKSLLNRTPDLLFDKSIFIIVDHFNRCLDLVDNSDEQINLAGVYLIAGRRAKASAAYSQSAEYFKTGIMLLGKDSWQKEYNLSLSLYSEAVESNYLTADYYSMEKMIETVNIHARSIHDRVNVYKSFIRSLTVRNKPAEAVYVGLGLLAQLGVKLPENPGRFSIAIELIKAEFSLLGKKIDDLAALPEMTDSIKLAIIDILSIMMPSAYMSTPDLFILMIIRCLRLSISYGNTKYSGAVYAGYGIVLIEALGNVNRGYQFGRLGIDFVETHIMKQYRTQTIFIFNQFINHTKHHVNTTLEPLKDAYRTGMVTGDLEYSSFSALAYSYHSFYAGVRLQDILVEIEKFETTMKHFKQLSIYSLINIYRQACVNLIEPGDDPTLIKGVFFNEWDKLPEHIEGDQMAEIFSVYLMKTILSYLFRRYSVAQESSLITDKYLKGNGPSFDSPVFIFYESLVRLSEIAQTTIISIKSFKIVSRNQKRLKKYSSHAPMNYEHKYLLVEAEKFRVLGSIEKAANYYDLSIELAGKNGFIQEEALGNELAARFYMKQDEPGIAMLYYREAKKLYGRWGSEAKIRDIDQQILEYSD